MHSLLPQVRVFVCTQPTDMRKSFDGLSALVAEVFEAELLSGHLVVFFNRRRDRIKILAWDRNGLSLWYKNFFESHYPHFFHFAEIGEFLDNAAGQFESAG